MKETNRPIGLLLEVLEYVAMIAIGALSVAWAIHLMKWR